MYNPDLYVALVVGVVLSLLYVEITGVLPAGLVVPGYLALIFDQPVFIFSLLCLSFLTYLLVTRGIGRLTILTAAASLRPCAHGHRPEAGLIIFYPSFLLKCWRYAASA